MLWHIFSYNVRECEEGEQAINSFKDILKDTLYSFYIFYQRKDTGYLIDNNTRAFIFDDMSIFITDFETAFLRDTLRHCVQTGGARQNKYNKIYLFWGDDARGVLLHCKLLERIYVPGTGHGGYSRSNYDQSEKLIL